MPKPPVQLSIIEARHLWLRAQRLDEPTPFGDGPTATQAAVRQLGYVQIDTINVIERCHHHILYTRIPGYRRGDLIAAQSSEKSVFEYWTHALAYLPGEDYRYYAGLMKQRGAATSPWYGEVKPAELRKLLRRIRDDGPLSIRDVDDEQLVEKTHLWASRKPSKAVLQFAFYAGLVTISERRGMLKSYELTRRHFGWDSAPRPATDRQLADYRLDRALRAQGVISLESTCYIEARSEAKKAIAAAIEARVRRKMLVPMVLEGAETVPHWATPETLDSHPAAAPPSLTHILSPFDPLIIQRKRTEAFFGYAHLFEAYVPKAKRKLGYFALPVLVGDEIVAALDLKTDRANGKLLIQSWTWVGKGKARPHKPAIEAALDRFETFQLDGAAAVS